MIKNGTETTALIQVCYEAISSEVEQRETKALFEASGELGVKKLIVLTWDEKREVKKDETTVQFIPLWEWLMGS